MADQEIPKDLLQRISELASKQVALENEIENMEQSLKDKNKELLEIAGGYGIEGKLIALLQEAGVKGLVLENGASLKIKDELKCPSMAADSEYRPKVVEWMEKNGHGGVVKNEVSVPFSKGDEAVKLLEEFLAEKKIAFEKYSTIHHKTLGKIIDEILKSGDELPMRDLGIQEFKTVKVSHGK